MNQKLQRELKDKEITIPFQYRVFNGDFATKVGSDNYSNLEGLKQYKSPLFVNEKGDSDFELVIAFPERKLYLRSSLTNLIFNYKSLFSPCGCTSCFF